MSQLKLTEGDRIRNSIIDHLLNVGLKGSTVREWYAATGGANHGYASRIFKEMAECGVIVVADERRHRAAVYHLPIEEVYIGLDRLLEITEFARARVGAIKITSEVDDDGSEFAHHELHPDGTVYLHTDGRGRRPGKVEGSTLGDALDVQGEDVICCIVAHAIRDQIQLCWKDGATDEEVELLESMSHRLRL